MIFPLSLKIVLGVFVILIILFIALKKQRKYIWPFFIVIIGMGAWLGFKEYNRKNENLANVKADIKITAVDLIHDYEANDSTSNQKYLGKIVEVGGMVKNIEKDDKDFYTIVLGDTSGLSSVRCSIDSLYRQDAAKLSLYSSAIVRGACTGFNKDELGLGSDVILNRCVIILKK